MNISFPNWLESRDQRPQVPEATRLTQIIAAAGRGGVTLRDLRRVITLDQDLISALLSTMLAIGSVEIIPGSGKGGETLYRAL